MDGVWGQRATGNERIYPVYPPGPASLRGPAMYAGPLLVEKDRAKEKDAQLVGSVVARKSLAVLKPED
jgi:hypothetical protein